MIESDLKSLEQFLKKPLPEIPEEVWTFLDIAGFPHYENVISNIYAYYFDKERSHGFKDLYLRALFSAIEKKARNTSFKPKLKYLADWNEWEVYREEPVKKQRIDILLKEIGGNEESYVIVENKMFHYLNNDLDTYWSIDKTNRKVGVVLSLFEEKPKHNGFINITHSEFFEEVKNLQGQYLEFSQSRDVFILKDLLLNINYQIMNQRHEPGLLKFYAEHKEKINEVVELHFRVKEAFMNEVNNIGESRGFEILSKRSKDYREYSIGTSKRSKIKNIGLQIYFNEELENEHFSIYIFLYGKLKTEYKSILSKRKTAKLKSFESFLSKKKISLYSEEGRNWIGVATKNYDLNHIDFDLDKLDGLVEQWLEVIEELKELLSS
ncbi:MULTISPECIES: PD-(D/E)XK nuclease family protein [Roseivirga]|nr:MULTISPECIES: PD-(D/E)XK nuclease family protein [Roseivirga]MBO6659338.1 PD-(D/E)XK nuclease family protein [Roseivirga sp.]MBO6907925.1 PD-(D/E)XK nuclease family protein [Roseivirga sp.]WPZ10278.1 PD-(D/E)XK nuclease family protein [Roseivirga spongicola]